MNLIVRLVLVSNKRGNYLPAVTDEDWSACPVSVSTQSLNSRLGSDLIRC